MRKLGLILLTLLALVGCHLPATLFSTEPVASGNFPAQLSRNIEPVRSLTGRVIFPAQRTTQATMTDVAAGATVALINTSNNQTVATTLTDSAGVFQLTFPDGFTPDPTAVYYMEAVKGLNSNSPGSNAIRVRTVARYQSGWTSMTNHSPNTGLFVISPSTTALAIGTALRNGSTTPPNQFNFSNLIGSISGGSADTYSPNAALSALVSAADFNSLLPLINQALTSNQDPVAVIGLSLPSTWIIAAQGGGSFSFTSISPASASVGTSVTLQGAGFSSDAASNSVGFNGAAGTVTAATSTALTVTVPAGATSGQTTIRLGNLIALGPTFTVVPIVSAFSPATGPSGTSVTISGSGFDATPTNNVVSFNGVAAVVTNATATSLTVTAPDSTTGPITVRVSGQSVTSASNFTYTACVLNAVNPSLVNTSNTMTIEGAFGSSATVNFPGGVSTAATVLGPNRLQVTIPAGATAGNLTVTSNSLTTQALPFRRASFSLGMKDICPSFGQAEAARTTSLATARQAHSTVAIGNYLYIIGGTNGTNLGSVERATINSDGSLSPFATVAGVTLVTARYDHTNMVIGNHLYVIGGTNGTPLNSVERATINSDGTLSTFSTVSVTLVTARNGHTSHAIGNYLYIIGGTNGTNLGSVERATINSDGSLSPFAAVAGVTLVTARHDHTSMVIGNYLYVIGGTNGTALNNLEQAAINSDGTIGTFTTVSGVTLLQARSAHSSVVLGNTLFVIAGSAGGTAQASVESATINTNGTLNTFATATAVTLSTARYGQSGALVGNYFYLLGGTNGTPLSTVERGIVDTTGGLGAFSIMQATALVTARSAFGSVALGGYLYVIGGMSAGTALSSVERASVNPDGTLGTFATVAGVTLRTARSYHSLAVVGSTLYVIGGLDNASSELSSIEQATIGADGTLGNFSTATPVLVAARGGHSSVVVGSTLYVIAGELGNGTCLKSIEQAPITGGVLGTFTTSARSLVTARTFHSNIMMGTTLYVIGGFDSTGGRSLRSIEQASLTGGTLGTFATSGVSMISRRDSFSLGLIGSTLYAMGGAGTGVDLMTMETCPITYPGGTLGSFTTSGQSLKTSRSSHTGVILGNYFYAIGGGGVNGASDLNSVEQAQLQ